MYLEFFGFAFLGPIRYSMSCFSFLWLSSNIRKKAYGTELFSQLVFWCWQLGLWGKLPNTIKETVRQLILLHWSSSLPSAVFHRSGFGPHILSLIDCDLSVVCQIRQRRLFKLSILFRIFSLNPHGYCDGELSSLHKRNLAKIWVGVLLSLSSKQVFPTIYNTQGERCYWSATNFQTHNLVNLLNMARQSPEIENTMVKKQLTKADPSTCL